MFDVDFDNFVNYWLLCQVFYYGDVNCFSIDLQMCNYLQDNLGMVYIVFGVMCGVLLYVLSQQYVNGFMFDGILFVEGVELKYINQVFYIDYCVWLLVCLQVYFDEIGDFVLFDMVVCDVIGVEFIVVECLDCVMVWLQQDCDVCGLFYIVQGDWCDLMNMVGYKGCGVFGWLIVVVVYVMQLWVGQCEDVGCVSQVVCWYEVVFEFNQVVNCYFWDGCWFVCGIIDDGVFFGVYIDIEGCIYFNLQFWVMFSGVVSDVQCVLMVEVIEVEFEMLYGVFMFVLFYFCMCDDVGCVMQKYLGVVENGVVYNYVVSFYIYVLYEIGDGDWVFRLLCQMIFGLDVVDYFQCGQLLIFIFNYYCGVYK